MESLCLLLHFTLSYKLVLRHAVWPSKYIQSFLCLPDDSRNFSRACDPGPTGAELGALAQSLHLPPMPRQWALGRQAPVGLTRCSVSNTGLNAFIGCMTTGTFVLSASTYVLSSPPLAETCFVSGVKALRGSCGDLGGCGPLQAAPPRQVSPLGRHQGWVLPALLFWNTRCQCPGPPQDRFPGRTHTGIALLFGLLVFRSLQARESRPSQLLPRAE